MCAHGSPARSPKLVPTSPETQRSERTLVPCLRASLKQPLCVDTKTRSPTKDLRSSNADCVHDGGFSTVSIFRVLLQQ